jgi:hypothetical protein
MYTRRYTACTRIAGKNHKSMIKITTILLLYDEHKPIQVLTVPMLLNFCTQIEGKGVSTSLGRWIWNLVCIVWSGNPVRILMWYELPDPKPSSNSDLPVAWITGPATEDPPTPETHNSLKYLTWHLGLYQSVIQSSTVSFYVMIVCYIPWYPLIYPLI